MIGRGAAAAGIATRLGNYSFRATGITTYLKNGGTLEKAAQMANHASTRTTQLCDRRREEISLDEVERCRAVANAAAAFTVIGYRGDVGQLADAANQASLDAVPMTFL